MTLPLNTLPVKIMHPHGEAWDTAVSQWRKLATDDGAYLTRASRSMPMLEPMITFGTNPGMGLPLRQAIPDPDKIANLSERRTMEKALDYMDLQPGRPLLGHAIDVVFIGSCTNSRISDLV